MRGIGISAVLALTPVPALAAPPDWAGIWAAEPAWCQWADRVGSHDPAPIELTETEVNGLENFCEIRGVNRIGFDRAWVLDLACSSEGDEYDDRTLLMLETPDILWRWYGAGEPVRYTRCGIKE